MRFPYAPFKRLRDLNPAGTTGEFAPPYIIFRNTVINTIIYFGLIT